MNGQGSYAARRGITLRRWVPYALFAVACAVSVYAAYFVSTTAEVRRRERFFADAAEIRQRLGAHLGSYVEVVRDSTALVAASNEIHFAEFRAFVKRLELEARYPGIAAIGFAARVSAPNLASFLAAMELDGAGPLRLRPMTERTSHDLVVFVEPMSRVGPPVIGVDLSADATQREAMAAAADSGEPVVAGRAGGAFATSAGDAVMLYVPVYRSSMPTSSVAERRRALFGFVFSPMQPSQLLAHAATATSLQPVTFEVYEGTKPVDSKLVHRSASATPEPEYASSGYLSIAGHTWLLVVKSVDGVPALLSRPVRNTLAGGLLLSFVLFAVMRLQIAAWETAKRHESEIRGSEQALRASEARLREALEREQEARAQAQAADRAKDDFLIAVSHELRTPISAMLGWLSMLQTGAIRDDRRAHALEVVERNARLQARLIEDLLDVSRILLGRMAVDLQPLAVGPVASLVVESLRPAAEKAGVDVRPPAVVGSCVIRGDAARVQQIVWNLISNAIKFTPPGGHVSVDVRTDRESVEIRVADTGIGIDAAFLPHVFERFRQADSSTGGQAGLGLGMAITRQLVELHGGTVDAFSEGRNRGTTFAVRFPVAASELLRIEREGVDADPRAVFPPVPGEGSAPDVSSYHQGGGACA